MYNYYSNYDSKLNQLLLSVGIVSSLSSVDISSERPQLTHLITTHTVLQSVTVNK